MLITYRVALVLTVMALFNSGCGLIDVFVRALEGYCEPPEWVVTRTDDPAGGGLCTAEDCSLRKALSASNSCPGTQTIRIPAGTYLLTRAGTDEDGNRTGDLDITDSVNVIGDGEAVIDGNGLDRVLDIFAPAHATLTSITSTNGSWVDGGGIRNAGTLTMAGGAIQANSGRRGGGLFNLGTAELDSVIIQDNLVERGFGGGIYNEGNLSLTHGAILRNMGTAGVQGGGLFNAGTAVLDGVNVEGNVADGGDGGGVYNEADTAISGGGIRRNEAHRGGGMFNVGTAALEGVAIEANAMDRLPGDPSVDAWGGGLYNSGPLTVTGGSVKGNGASYGGGIANVSPGTLGLDGVLLEGNRADVDGGGIFNSGGEIEVVRSTFSQNEASIGGGAIENVEGSVNAESSTINGNRALHGAGIVHEVGEMQLTNVTISGNRNLGEYHGAGISNRGLVTLNNVTVVSNQPDDIWYEGAWGFIWGTRFKSTIVGICSLGDPSYPFDSAGDNLDVNGTCGLTGAGDLSDVDPLLEELLNNGGPTLTRALLPGSPAIDGSGSCLAADQRGFPRPAGAACDIGAYEYDPANSDEPESTPTLVPSPMPAPVALPTFTFTQQANCRKGPNTLYDSLGFGQAGQQAQIEGLSEPLGWYYVLLPDGVTRCFVAGSTGTLTGPLDGLDVIPAPELPVIPAPLLPVAPAAPVLNVSNQTCDTTHYVVRLSWKDVEGETGYRVYRDGAMIATLSADAASYDDTSPDYKSHSYQVEAYNDYGAAGSSVKDSEGCVY